MSLCCCRKGQYDLDSIHVYSDDSEGMDRDENSLFLLLVGKTGSGISSTCKSIDPSSEARELGGFASVTERIETGEIEVDGTHVKVVASPGIRNSDDDSGETQRRYFQDVICESFQHSPTGFDAIVLTVSYLERIHFEFKTTIEILQSVLGKDALRKNGVLLLTGGDNLLRDLDGKMTVDEWAESQTGYLRVLIDACGFRCVVFDNVTDSDELKASQLGQLMENVRQAKKAYSYDAFSSTNRKYVEGGKLREVKNIIRREYNRIGQIGARRLKTGTPDEINERQQQAIDEVNTKMSEDHRITHITLLRKLVDSMPGLKELAYLPRKNEKYKRQKIEFRDLYFKTFGKTFCELVWTSDIFG